MSGRHQKLFAEPGGFGVTPWADHYHYGPDDPGPLVIYVGGAITREEYERRRETTPDAITAELEKVLPAEVPLDLLVVPNPVFAESSCRDERREFLKLVVFDLLPQTANPRPQRIGLVGYSRGAFLAAGMAFDLPRVVAAAFVGGADMGDAVTGMKPGSAAGKKFFLFGNADDPLVMENYSFMKDMVDRDVWCDADLRLGGHDFADFTANGSIADAFHFVITNFNY